MPADRGERTAHTKRAGPSDDETARNDERSDDRSVAQDEQDEQDDRDEQEGQDGQGSAKRAGGLDVAAAAQAGRRLIAAVTNREPEGVTSVEPVDTGWVIEVEVLEDRHIPSSADVLALYEVELDGDGTMLSYRRTQRYTRGRGNGTSRRTGGS
ncbi:MAG TPA: gas vesicle protein GvpO [Streptosporangiaceae bacterium]|nr:gas vesicle protein GvpO [Streptosporangiaceae bacterium]